MKECQFINLIQQNNGNPYIVGGYVRDTLLNIQSKDKDYVVTGISETTFISLFPEAVKKNNNEILQTKVFNQKFDSNQININITEITKGKTHGSF